MKSSMNFSNAPPDPVGEALAAVHKSALISHLDDTAGVGVVGDAIDLDNEEDMDRILNSMAAEAEPVKDISGGTAAAAAAEEGTPIVADEFLDDLQPGGGAAPVADGADVSDTSNETVLNGMGLKELRELAKQKKIDGAKTMRKHELVAAIRASKTVVTPFEIHEGVLDLN